MSLGPPIANRALGRSRRSWTGSAPPPEFAPADTAREDLAEIIFTSGATSEPKGVRITHRNILANIVPVENEVRRYRRWGGPFFPVRFLNLLPLSHMFGQVLATFIPPMLPGITVFMRGFNPEEIAALIRKERVSVLVSVPKMLEILRDHVVRLYPEAASAPASGISWPVRWWRYRGVHRLFGWKFWAFVVGAAPLPPEVEDFWSRLGYLVIQGYGLTETAPIVTLNHPFHARRGTTGTPIGGVKVQIADDGEILVRGDNVTSGYWSGQDASQLQPQQIKEGWLHTGDIGSIDPEGRLTVRGRKKEMIVTPEGLKVFPEDVERVLLQIPGVKDAAVVGRDRVHAVLVPATPETDVAEIVRAANGRLEDHQRIQGVSVWRSRRPPAHLRYRETQACGDSAVGGIRRRFGRCTRHAGAARQTRRNSRSPHGQRWLGRSITSATTLEELGLSSLERVELMMEAGLTEAQVQQAHTIGELSETTTFAAPVKTQRKDEFPRWSRSWLARLIRNASLPTWILPIGRIFCWIRTEGLENLKDVQGPVIFASNHQSILDVPCILTALPFRWRKRVAPAAAREWFQAHFHPERFPVRKRFSNGFSYYLAVLFFNMFTLPQQEAGAMGALRYAGELVSDGWCILIFPEGVRTDAGEIHPFQPGVAMMASKLGVPVVPVRLEGLDKILHESWHMARPGPVRIKFGPPVHLAGEDYAELARQVEQAVRSL